MKNINPFFLATGLVFLVCGYAWAGGSIEFLGNFSGGTVGAPVVFTGDNANGTGTVRIRPSDEDTQLVLCEASNNSTPEVCSSWQHYNTSSTASASFFATNLYLDSASGSHTYANGMGTGYFQTAASTIAGAIYMGVRHPLAADNSVNYTFRCQSTGATTATCYTGDGHTVTSDIRGPITNGGSATCNGINAGSVCINDDTIVQYSSGGAFLNQYSTVNTTGTGSVWFTSAGAAAGSNGYYNASFADADYADKATLVGYSKLVSVIRSDDVAAGTTVMEVRDNASATGVKLVDIDGAGNIKLDSGATRSRGTITLAAGTGTATVTSGAICVCTDTTSNVSVKCAVSATTLTATGTGTDVIAYHCL